MFKYIIIVEDETMLADALVNLLEDYEQAANHIALCLVDMGLPDMSGVQFSKKLHILNPDIPVVLFSGYMEDDMDTSNTHIVEELQKPVSNDVLFDLIKKHS